MTVLVGARRVLAVGVALALVATGLVAVVRLTHDDRGCYTTRSSVPPAYPGRSASRVYDWRDVAAQTGPRFAPGPALPAALLAEGYVPQGLAGWADRDGTGEDLLLVSAYHEADGPSAVFAVVAAGPRAGTSAGRLLVGPGHVGGLAVLGGWLYVGTEHEIRGYRLARVGAVLAGSAHDRAGSADAVEVPAYTRSSSLRGHR